MINIRTFKKDDLNEIAIIESLCFSTPWSHNALCDFAGYEHNSILVAEQDNGVVGYITYSCIIDEIQIANVATHPDYRKQDVAKNLVETLKTLNKDFSIITLEVRQSNIPAQNLYQKCGFEIAGKRRNFYSSPTEDAILMNYTF